MKKLTYSIIAVVAIAAVCTTVFWEKLRELQTLYQYSQLFAPDIIDKNFRTMHQNQNHVVAKRNDEVFELMQATENNLLPQTYVYEQETNSLM